MLRQAFATERSALARLLRDVPHPRPSYAGIPAEDAADIVRRYTGKRLKELTQTIDGPKFSDRVKERARATLTKRLAQLNALQDDPNLPEVMRADVQNALHKFNE